jgi:hypothetical protein
VHLGAAVGDEDLLAVDEVAVALLRHTRDDAAEIGAGLRLGQIHRPLQLARREARQIALLQLVAAVLLDVDRRSRRKADDGHEARVGACNHLEVGAVEERREAVAPVLRRQHQAEHARLAEFRVAGADVRRHDHLAVLEPHLLVPVLERASLDVLADVAHRPENGAVRLDLVARVDRVAVAEPEVARPVDAVIHEELDVAMEEFLAHPCLLRGGIVAGDALRRESRSGRGVCARSRSSVQARHDGPGRPTRNA